MARIPRGIGARTGVKLAVTPGPAAAASPSACSISGVCRCVPPAWYAETAPITSLASRSGRSARPAPEVPEAATITMSSGSARPAASSGASATMAAVA